MKQKLRNTSMFELPTENETGDKGTKGLVDKGINRQGDKGTHIKKSYYLTPVLIEALRLYTFENRIDASTYVREMLEKFIPEDYIKKAKEAIKDV